MSDVVVVELEQGKGLPARKVLEGVLEQVDLEKPDPIAVKQLKAMLASSPKLCNLIGGDVTAFTQDRLIERLYAQESTRMALRHKARVMRDGLGYEDSSQLEQMLIEHVVLCWLRLQDIEWRYQQVACSGESKPIYQCEWWEKRLNAVQRRYLRACETLARVRKLTRRTPALQVNIATQGGQQVNVAGKVEVQK